MREMTSRSRLVIVSGGQSGVDRAALDVANELAIPYAGFCPRGGWAEDFPQPPAFWRAIRCCVKRRLPIRRSALNGTCKNPMRC
jgi:hypothetical protein